MNRARLSAVFEGKPKPAIIGMVHLPPLPGSPAWGGSIQAVVDRACADAEALCSGGIDGIMVENFGDMPFFADTVPAETVAALARVATEIARLSTTPLGVNVLRNDGMAALAIATSTGARFIRVNVLSGTMATDQGWIRGRAAEILRLRETLKSEVAIMADVMVKHATPPVGLTLAGAASDAWHRGGADALIVSGRGTGKATALADLETVASAVPAAQIWVGSGADEDSVQALATRADGIIVGSAIQQNGEAGRAIDPSRLARFMSATRRSRR